MFKPLLELFIKDVINESIKTTLKTQAIAQLADSTRTRFLKVVAEGYTKEVAHNLSQYVRSVESATVTVTSDNQGERLFLALQSALKSLEVELEQQGPDSAIVKYLKSKYGEPAESLVGRKPMPVYTTVAGFSSTEYADQPWLNRVISESPAINEILSNEASRLFDRLFPSIISRTL
jgi:hypothetical protein